MPRELIGERSEPMERSAPGQPRPPTPRSAPATSSERHALPSASLNVRPIAMTSPTDFMVEVSTGSASGNFSNANRGTLTTT